MERSRKATGRLAHERPRAAGNSSAAEHVVLDGLADVLREASVRGIDLAASFKHFDRRHEGLVGAEEFMAAVVELRIGGAALLWDERDAESCIERISRGRSRAYFSRDDFAAFFATRVNARAAFAADPETRSENRRVQQQQQQKKKKTAVKPSKKPKLDSKQSTGGDADSSSNQTVGGSSPIRDYLDEYHTQHIFESLNDTKTGMLHFVRQQHARKKRPLVTLPSWAHDRSKRALQEFEQMQQRKKRLPPSLSSRLFYNGLDQEEDDWHTSEAAEQERELEAVGIARLKLPVHNDPQNEILEFPVDAQWKTFALDVDTTLSYAILSHETMSRSSDSGDADGSPTRKTKPLSSSKYKRDAEEQGGDDDEEPLPVFSPFRFTVFLDVFQRLETLDAFFRPLLTRFPRGKILLCGFPTRTPRTTIWNNDCFAQAYGKLLVHVIHTTREWLVQPKLGVGAVPQFVIGFGTGGGVALRLLAAEIPLHMQSQPQLQLFLRAQRGLVLINALAHTSDGVRRSLQQLKRVFSSNGSAENRAEIHEALILSMFSEFYLTQVAASRQTALQTFFSTRKQFLQSSSMDLLRFLLHGSIKSRDVSQWLSNLSALESPFSLVLVHGTLNALFPADQVEFVTQAFAPACMSPTLEECLACDAANVGDSGRTTTPRVHVSWLKSGHNVLQERANFMHDLFRQLVLIDTAGIPANAPGSTNDSEGAQQQPSQYPISQPTPERQGTVETSTMRKEEKSSEHLLSGGASERSPLTDMTTQASELLAQHGIKWIQQELYDRGVEGSGSTDAILTRYQQALEAEFAEAREKEIQNLLQQARFDALEAERRERQREELDHQLREKEAQLRIKRRELEAQKAFFAQMEQQKETQARMALEHELMALEDVLSQKHEESSSLADERQLRNTDMTKKVEEIEAERLEQEREAFQVQLQQERLVAQHAKREQLKRFQREFEQNELVSSPVEAYTLDLAPKYENFGALAGGADELTKDLVHFYELKASQKDESAEKRLELERSKKILAEKELTVRNLERVILKAKSTGMIAKAGLGTVRIVPISAHEFQLLSRELDEKQDELARLQSDLALRTQELGWKDKLLQRLSELIKRNEAFRDEMLKKLAVCAEKGNEMVLSAREEDEKLFEQREANTELEKRFSIRLQTVEDERRRASESPTEYFDSRLRVEGTTQRVVRKVLLREHDAEISNLAKRLGVAQAHEVEIRAKLKVNKITLSEYGAQTFKIEQSLTGLEQAIAAKDRRASIATADGGSSLGALGDSSSSLAVLRPHLAEHVRMKPHADRSVEEKQWVALDFQVNFAHYYKCIDAEQVEVIQRHPEYQQCPLKKNAIQRLLQLPARNCLALAFFKAKEELEAHSLLRKYTFGDGEAYFASQDDSFVLESEQSSTCIVTTKLAELAAAVDAASVKGKAAGYFIPRGSYALLDESDDSIATAMPSMSLLSASQCQIHPHKSATHTFKLPPLAGGVGVLSVSVSIVFQGHFKSVGYQNGRLAGMLYVLPPSSENQSASRTLRAPVSIGKCFYAQDIVLCTPHSLGKLVIRHDPTRKPLSAAATYQVVLGAPVFTAYSIEVTASTALFASEVLKRKRSDALKKQELLPLKKDEIQQVFITIQLSERKKRLARKMANDAKDTARAAELEMIRKTKALEEDNAVSTLSHEQRSQLHSDVHSSETKFTQHCFMYAKREEEARDIELALKELTKIHADLLEQCNSMERDLVEYRAHLPQLAASLVDSKDPHDRDAAGAKLARELNVEFESSGMKSGKVLWAEISAMKAKLPSMMTPAERLRRKYKKGQEVLEKKEREWILVDRILHPRVYDWEERLVVASGTGVGDSRMRLHSTFPKLTKDEEQLAVLSHVEVDRIMKAPWNLLERKEIQIRKIVTKFRDDNGANGSSKKQTRDAPPTSMVALLRSQKTTELTTEEREWRLYDQLLNPSYYPVNMKRLAEELRSVVTSSAGGGVLKHQEIKIPANLTREDLVAALNAPEEELFKLPSDSLRARTLLLKYDPQLSVNLVEAARIQHGQSAKVEVVEMDIDARCRLVYQELQRAIANTRNEFMDSYVLHSTLQRFPTKVLRLELEKELDRLLASQVVEKEEFELKAFLLGGDATKKALGLAATSKIGKRASEDSDSVSDSDSDEEAQIAREAKVQRRARADAKAGKNAKVRGKALKQKSIQKQRREIKDALKGRSLEERRLLLEEQELGAGGCMACRTNPCVWTPYLQESHVTIERRMEVLQAELERVKRCPELTIESTLCLAAVKSGGNSAIAMRKADLFDEVTLELKIWDKHLRLRGVDDEFHATFRSKEQFFETKALHGFPQTQQRDKVQVALQRQHNLLVANLTAYEVVEDILEFLLEGWVFGERESERKALGFVPSLKRDGPLTMHDLRVFEQEQRILDGQRELSAEENVQGVPLEKWKPIEVQAFEVNLHNKAVKKGSDMDKQLTETENALKFGLFCMTLMYFRGLSMLKKQKTVWSTSATASKHGTREQQQQQKTAERQRMDREAKNVAMRQQRAAIFDQKAQNAQARKLKFLEQKTAAYRKRLVLENQKAKRETRAAQEIQRVYRGHLGKIAGKKWMLRRREIDAQKALERAAATMLQRAYRGRLGRIEAEERRVELAEFISQLRAEEAIEEEEEYWRRHRVERAARKVVAFVKKEA